MNKAFEIDQLRGLLTETTLSSGLYLLDTELNDVEIETCIKGNSSFQYVSGKLVPTSRGNVFELLIVGLSYQCKDRGIVALRERLMTADDDRKREVIIYSLVIQILRQFCVNGKTVVHLWGRIDFSSIEPEDLDKFDAALSSIDETIIIICKQKNTVTPKGGSIMNKSLKRLNKKRLMEGRLQKVHISYKHDNSFDSALEAIKNGLKKNNIEYSIDVQDIKYREDIVKYEKEIGRSDRVIMFIIPSYLKSLDCMFEMTEIFKNSDVRDRVFPVVEMGTIPRNRDGLKVIKDFWHEQKVKASAQMQMESGISDYTIDELSKINAIIKMLDDFWDYIVHINTGNYEKLIENDAALLMEEIQRTIPSRTAAIDEKFVPSLDTIPVQKRTIIQNGSDSIYLENSTGPIIINSIMPKRSRFSTEIRYAFDKPYIKVFFYDESDVMAVKDVVDAISSVKKVNTTKSESAAHLGDTLIVYPKPMVSVEECEKDIKKTLCVFFDKGIISERKPVRNEAHFNNIADQIINDLDKARVSIHVCMAWFTNQRIADKLIEKYKEGVDVKVISFDDHTNAKFGVNLDSIPHKKIRGTRGGTMHNKFCVIDNQKVITGSYNWSDNAENKNDENAAVMYDYDRASDYSVEFRKLFDTD